MKSPYAQWLYSDRMNRDLERDYIQKLESHLEVVNLSATELELFRDRATTVYEFFVDRNVLTQDEIRRARDIAGSD